MILFLIKPEMNGLGQYQAVSHGNSQVITTHSPQDIHVCLQSFPPGYIILLFIKQSSTLYKYGASLSDADMEQGG